MLMKQDHSRRDQSLQGSNWFCSKKLTWIWFPWNSPERCKEQLNETIHQWQIWIERWKIQKIRQKRSHQQTMLQCCHLGLMKQKVVHFMKIQISKFVWIFPHFLSNESLLIFHFCSLLNLISIQIDSEIPLSFHVQVHQVQLVPEHPPRSVSTWTKRTGTAVKSSLTDTIKQSNHSNSVTHSVSSHTGR